MTINKFLCIGSACEGLFMTKKLGLRYTGPVDNLGLRGFKYTYKLFNNEFYNQVISNEYTLDSNNVWDSNYPVTYFGINKNFKTADTYFMMHNDYRLQKTRNELIKRLKLLNKYIDNAKNDKSLFFIYSIIYEDEYISDKDIIETLNKLPEFVKNRLLVLDSGRFKNKCILENYFPIFKDSIRNTDESYLKVKFNNWWLENKYFYESKNNQEYTQIIYNN